MWNPIDRDDLQTQIANGEKVMDDTLWPLWQSIRIEPVKWQLHPWGDQGSGFWVVAIFGKHVLWFNDIEWGFNISRYSAAGTIDEYCCNQDELHDSIFQIKRMMTTGQFPGRFGPPQPLEDGGTKNT